MPTFTILGCGSSLGVPRIDGNFGNCNPKNKKNFRTRCSAFLRFEKKNILIDTSPDIRSQLLKNKISNINTVLYSHLHADQTHGINDLRFFFLKNKKKIPVYADLITRKYLLENFTYCFKKDHYPPTLDLKKIKTNLKFTSNNKTLSVRAVPVKHGSINSIAYIFNKKCAYASDVNFIYKKDIGYFKNLKYLILDCLRYDPHPSHFNLNQCLEIVKKLKPKKTILTNLSSEIDYSSIKRKLPKNVYPAFDGITLKL
jgi:phosphoribosyl 1,2-cyclic phosphate phosphodiesterase